VDKDDLLGTWAPTAGRRPRLADFSYTQRNGKERPKALPKIKHPGSHVGGAPCRLGDSKAGALELRPKKQEGIRFELRAEKKNPRGWCRGELTRPLETRKQRGTQPGSMVRRNPPPNLHKTIQPEENIRTKELSFRKGFFFCDRDRTA